MSHTLSIDLQRLLADIERLARFGVGPDGGVTRFTLDPAYLEARAWLAGEMTKAGLACRVDGAGNLIGRHGGDGPAVMVGSHIDTAPSGGRLDGAYGVLAGLECFRVLSESSTGTGRPFELCCFLDEHGRYMDCLGSKAMTGQLDEAELASARSPDGETVPQAFREAGLDPDDIFEARRAPEEIALYLELHIEQGPVLDTAGVPIGVVDRIASILRRDFVFEGVRNHAGQTPLNARRDALRGASELVTGAFGEAGRMDDGAVRMNFGAIECRPGATSTIPGFVRIRQEIRDPDGDRLKALAEASDAIATSSAARHGLSLDIRPVGWIAGTALSSTIKARIVEAAERLGVEHQVMASGTGHDSQVMAKFVKTGLILVPSREGRSHCPEEDTASGDLEAGANVLLGALAGLLR